MNLIQIELLGKLKIRALSSRAFTLPGNELARENKAVALTLTPIF